MANAGAGGVEAQLPILTQNLFGNALAGMVDKAIPNINALNLNVNVKEPNDNQKFMPKQRKPAGAAVNHNHVFDHN